MTLFLFHKISLHLHRCSLHQLLSTVPLLILPTLSLLSHIQSSETTTISILTYDCQLSTSQLTSISSVHQEPLPSHIQQPPATNVCTKKSITNYENACEKRNNNIIIQLQLIFLFHTMSLYSGISKPLQLKRLPNLCLYRLIAIANASSSPSVLASCSLINIIFSKNPLMS